MGKLEEALNVLSPPGDYAQDVYTLRGDLQLDLGRVHEALGSYSTVIALSNGNLYAQQKLAICFRKLEKWEPAVDTLRKILTQDSYSDSARIALGDCLLHLRLPEDALKCFEGCWSENALFPSLFGKAVALQLLQRRDQAEGMYRRLLDLEPACEEALGNLIAITIEQYAFSRAQRYAEQLLGLRPESRIALGALVVTALERREYESASEYYRRLLAAPPDKEPSHNRSKQPVSYRLGLQDLAMLTGRGALHWTDPRSQ